MSDFEFSFLSEDDREGYLHGSCGIVAVFLHRRLGLPIYAMWDELDVEGEALPGNPGALVHYFVGHVTDEEQWFMDVEGKRSLESIARDFGFEVEHVVVTRSNVEDIEFMSGPVDDAVAELERFANEPAIAPSGS